MRITKKAVSIVLAILMVTTMMSVMAVSASAQVVTVVDLSEQTESYVITDGGNYQFTGTSTLAKPVIIDTSEAVTIQDSTIVTTKTGDTGYAVTVIAADSNVTIKDSTLKSYARAIEYDFDVTPQTGTLTVDNTTMVTYGLEEENYTTTLVNGGSATKRAVNFGKVNINATFTNSTFAGYHYAINFTQQAEGANSTVTATNCKFYARAALNNWAPNLTATFNSCTVYAINNFGGSSESFAAFVVYDGADNTKVYLNNTEVFASYNGAGVTNANAVNNLLDVRGNNCIIEAKDSSYTDTTKKGSIVSEDNVLEYLLDGDTNTVIINGGTYDCNFPETYDASAYAVYISDPDIDASNVSITQFYANVIEVQAGTFTDEVPAEYLSNTKDVVHNNDTGKYEIVDAQTPYVARVGNTRYTTLQAAIDAAPSGATVTLVDDIDFSKVTVHRNAHDSHTELKIDLKDLTLDLDGHKITSVNASVVYTGNGATIENGSFALKHVNDGGSSYQAGTYGLCLDGYGVENSITLNNLDVEGGINVWGANVEINDCSATTTASKYYAVWAEGNSNVVINSGTFTDNASGGKGIIATGTTGNERGAKVEVKGGTFTGVNKVVAGAEENSIAISGGTFSKDEAYAYIADGAFVTKNANGSVVVSEDLPTTTTTAVDATAFNIGKFNIHNYEILGIQVKEGTGVRFVTAVNEGFLKGANIADYGYVLAKVDGGGLSQAGIGEKFNTLKYNGGNGEKTVSCKGSSNTLSGEFGKFSTSTPYKFVTAIVENMAPNAQAVARFYIKTTDGNIYYANYINNGTYGGVLATMPN